ncbi:hypothetical protein [Aeromicrobium sp. CnD17-E]|uniref:hypothetical protein n=1 Tax=Aeromicrobium sp. CnD17-E TaxID=2954487 RepID=UPI0020972D8E|nr:hypothetical protein [Aeromicrobium sp. CnD17-E]MCO7240657.1 hypothetical protein [Aeromicrobium sp. CnD17-E]
MTDVDELLAILDPAVRPFLGRDDSLTIDDLVVGGEKLEAVTILARAASRHRAPIAAEPLERLQRLAEGLPPDRLGDVAAIREALHELVPA